MSEKVSVSTAALLTLSTGIVMVDKFEGMYEAAEAVIGHAIFTHEFPNYSDKFKELIISQIPDFPVEATSDNYKDVLSTALSKYGETIEIEKGESGRFIDPVTSFTDAIKDAKKRIG